MHDASKVQGHLVYIIEKYIYEKSDVPVVTYSKEVYKKQRCCSSEWFCV